MQPRINKSAIKYIQSLPFTPLDKAQIKFILDTTAYKQELLTLIREAKQRIYVTTLYWQNDDAGQEILDAIYVAKKHNPDLEVKIFVDFHRAQRGRLGESNSQTNAQWYASQRELHQLPKESEIKLYGVPINTRELFGVLHIKGFIFDDTILYSGASINDVYLNQQNKYRYDRYHQIKNKVLADSFVSFIDTHLQDDMVQRLDYPVARDRQIKGQIRRYRKQLSYYAIYQLNECVKFNNNQLLATPLFGLGIHNSFNQTIDALFKITQDKLTICTPYFNLPKCLQKRVKKLLKSKVKVDIIVGDKTANDFYTPPEQPQNLASALPYLYENNLRQFCKKFQQAIDDELLNIHIWKDQDNSFHLKGVWIDHKFILLTGNNLNPRAWRLDAENGILISDPLSELQQQVQQELQQIKQHTTRITHHSQFDEISNYPVKIQKILKRFARLRADKLVKMLL